MLTLAAWLHDLDPFVVRFTETFGIRWYGLAYVGGFLAAWFILTRLARRGLILIKAEAVGDLIVAVILGTLIGGRLGYVLIYHQDLLTDFRAPFPWWGLLRINEGGMASHGGIIGIIMACWVFARRHNAPMLHIMDCLGLVAPIGIFLGRLANFINGELLGRIVAQPGAPAPWWAVKYPQEWLEPRLAPVLTDEQEQSLRGLIVDVGGPERTEAEGLQGLIDALHAHRPGIAERAAPLVSARHPSQLYQALAEGIVLGAILCLFWMKPRRPGAITAAFFIVYGVGRVITEFWRLPDAHLTVQRIGGLSRGQWLSVGMVMVGAALAAYVAKRSAPKIGGWKNRAVAVTG